MIQIKLYTKWETEIILYPENNEELKETIDEIRHHFKNRWVYLGLGACIDMNDIKYILELDPEVK